MDHATPQILVLGGYGAVGQVVAATLGRTFRGRVYAAGRSLQAAEALSRSTGGAVLPMALDLADLQQLARVLAGIRLVIECAGREDIEIVRACLERGIDYIDISASDPFLRQVEGLAGLARQHGARALLSVGLTPGATNLLARQAIEQLGSAEALHIGVLLGLGEAHGAAAIAWTLERLGHAGSFRAAQQMRFPEPHGWRTAYRFDFADQHVVRRTLGLTSAATWLCFDSAAATRGLALIKRAGVLGALGRPGVRRRLAQALGRFHIGGDTFAITVEARQPGSARTYRGSLAGHGQGAATGLIAALVAEQLYTDRGPPGVYHIEQRYAPAAFFQLLGARGLSATSSVEVPGDRGAPGPGAH